MRGLHTLGVFVRFLLLAATLIFAGLVTPVAAQDASPTTAADSITITGLVKEETTLTVTDLQAMPTETIDVTYESGGTPEDHTFTGTPFLGIIESIGLDVPEDARNPLLQIAFIVTANDGYRVLISGGELDPNFGNTPMYLAWEQDGELLQGENGPVRLVVPGDTRGGRYVHGIVNVEVLRLP